MDKTENSFFLNQETYESNFKQLIYQYKNIRNAIQFGIILPFQLPLPDCSIVSFKEDNYILSYFFSHIEQEKKYTAGDLEETGQSFRYFSTRVEMTFFSEKYYYLLSEFELSNVFNLLLETLNFYITAIQINKKI
ncbi:hypothetical protein [Neobacillus niacini]|uniref:hypothetical protein n=1 Tax=Neobacillus niacini TaxID=86668 RepID=UPI000AD87171|nr:hypothetical protein [Neobacillus niacini]